MTKDQPEPAQVDRTAQARQAASDAYDEARHDVYDQLPVGPVDPEQLTHKQQATLDRLEQAEEHLDDLRREGREEPGAQR